MTIRSENLTLAEHKAFEERYAPYHNFMEFWIGFVDYQNGRREPNGWANSVAGQAWDRGAEAATRIIRDRELANLGTPLLTDRDLEEAVKVAERNTQLDRERAEEFKRRGGNMKTMFAKRHYEAIALAMQEAKRRAKDGFLGEGYGMTCAVSELADLFAHDNGRFNRERFLAACEPGANVKLRTRYKLPRETKRAVLKVA